MFLGIQKRASVDLPGAGFFCFLGIALVLGAERAQAQIEVSSVAVRGNDAFTSEDILSWFSTRTGEPFSRKTLQDDLATLQKRYRQSGYLLVTIDSVQTEPNADSISTAICIFLSEGGRGTVRAIEFHGNNSIPPGELAPLMKTQVGGEFAPSFLEGDLRRILELYETKGFPFAKISVENIRSEKEEDGYAVWIGLTVEEGPAARVSELKIEGNKTTKNIVLVREARLGGDEVYTDRLGERIKRRLERLQLFSSVSVPEFYVSEQGKGGLLIHVSEGNQIRFDGILGYIPGTDNGERGYVTGLIDLQFRNLFGTGRKLATRWYRENRASQELALNYTEPWVASMPLTASAGFFQRKQDSTYVRQTYDVSFAFVVTEEFSAGLSLEQTNVFATDRPGNPVGKSKATNAGVSVFYDARDDPVLPTRGVLYRTTYEIGTKILNRPPAGSQRSEDRTGKLTFDLECYLSPVSRQVIAAAVHIKDFRSTLVEQSDLFRLGGATTLRGYRESQFFGSRIIWASTEYRFLVGGRSSAFGFLDGGYVVMPENPSAGLVKSEQTKLGYGIGVRLETSLGLIGMSLALGEHDTVKTGKLHLRLVNEF